MLEPLDHDLKHCHRCHKTKPINSFITRNGREWDCCADYRAQTRERARARKEMRRNDTAPSV